MSAIEPVQPFAMEENTALKLSQPKENTEKALLRKNRHTLMASHARIKFHDRTIKAFKKHLKEGTFPKRFKSLRPFPKMASPEAQPIVNAACEACQVQCVNLQQMLLEQEKKLAKEQALKVQRKRERKRLQKAKKPKKPTVAEKQQVLVELHARYDELCSKLENTK